MAISDKHGKSITILGSTGSIGKNTIKVIQDCEEAFYVDCLTANNNYKLLAHQAINVKAKKVVLTDETHLKELKNLLFGTNIEVLSGKHGLLEAAAAGSDIVMSAIVGSTGLAPTITAIENSSDIALANKECLVCAGDLMTEAAKHHNSSIVPVDSEHSAIFQVCNSKQPKTISKIILTASGGPFRNHSHEQMKNITVEQAIAHPNWSMGKKISTDSATMMNKALEVIEAYYLFPVSIVQIDVIIHPESIIHSMVEYIDGSVLAQMGTADMKTPISYALSWPNRFHNNYERLDLVKQASLNFEAVDQKKFPSINLAKQALKAGGATPLILNAANEIAVEQFFQQHISFLDITRICHEAIENISLATPTSIDDVIEADIEARHLSLELIGKFITKAA